MNDCLGCIVLLKVASGSPSRGDNFHIFRGTISARLLLMATTALALTHQAITSRAATITFETRLACQRAIEGVYWKHRIWPEHNPGFKPSLDAVLPAHVLKARVEDSLRLSNALEVLWGQTISGQQLQMFVVQRMWTAQVDAIMHPQTRGRQRVLRTHQGLVRIIPRSGPAQR